jgi:3-deoxy-D-manno-octulosonic-acid transferase
MLNYRIYLIIYKIFALVFLPIYLLLVLARLFASKENSLSVMQKLGFAWPKRPEVKSPLIWINAASVGESNVAVNLINMLHGVNIHHQFILTVGTMAAYERLNDLALRNTIIIFAPLDFFWVVERYLKYFKPTCAFFIEAELWPYMLGRAAKIMPILLLNARMSDKSYSRWQKLPKELTSHILNHFTKILAQSARDCKKYSTLGAKNLIEAGNIKFANQKPEFDEHKLSLFKADITGKYVLVAMSTHQEDEDALLPIIKQLKEENIFTILILRHVNRVHEVANACEELGLRCSLRSNRSHPEDGDDLYIVDILGEVAMFYELADLVMIGGSFGQRGGHNLLEPAMFGKIMLCGPDMSNYSQLMQEIEAIEGIFPVHNSQELLAKILHLTNLTADKKAEIQNKLLLYIAQKQEIKGLYLKEMLKFLQ